MSVAEASRRLLAGELVAFPTETFYGLAADPYNKSAVAKLAELKSRLENMPLIAGDEAEIETLVEEQNPQVRLQREALQSTFWPGPLTLVFKANNFALKSLSEKVFGADGTLALRVSPHPTAAALASMASGLITATSANPKGEDPAKTAEQVQAYFPDIYVLGDAPLEGGLPSTIVRVLEYPFVVLRDGKIAREELSSWLS